MSKRSETQRAELFELAACAIGPQVKSIDTVLDTAQQFGDYIESDRVRKRALQLVISCMGPRVSPVELIEDAATVVTFLTKGIAK